MDNQEKQKLLKNLLGELSPEGTLESLAGGMPGSALESMPMPGTGSSRKDSEIDKGLHKISRDEDLDADEMFALEAIVLPQLRPVINIIEGNFERPPNPWGHYADDSHIHDNITKAIPSVGRIEVPDHPQIPYGGTGFVVGDGLLMTNRHVAELFALGLGRDGLRFRSGQSAGIDFEKEAVPSSGEYLHVREVVMIHPYWDMALLRVDGLDDGQKVLGGGRRNTRTIW